MENMNLRLSIREALLVEPQLQLAACSANKIFDVANHSSFDAKMSLHEALELATIL